MNKIYSVETFRKDDFWFEGYYETLEEAEKCLEYYYEHLKGNIGVIIYEITSAKDYDTREEFLEDLEEFSDDGENFFMEDIKRMDKDIEKDEHLDYLETRSFKKEIEEEIIGKNTDIEYLEYKLYTKFSFTVITTEINDYSKEILLYAENKGLGIYEYCLGEVIYEYLEDEKCYLVKGVKWEK